MTKPRKDPDATMERLKQAVRAVLDDRKASASEKVRAIEAGAKLLMIEAKIKMTDDPDANFFT